MLIIFILKTEEQREWFGKRMESTANETLDDTTRINIATELLKSQAFDNFLANKFTGLKRYGGEGAESMMAFFSEFFKLSTKGTVSFINKNNLVKLVYFQF